MIYAVKKRWSTRTEQIKNQAIPFHQQAFLHVFQYSYFRATAGCLQEESEEWRVRSSERGWMQSSRSHDGGIKKRGCQDEKQQRPVRKSVMCDLFLPLSTRMPLSRFPLFYTLLLLEIFLCSSIFLVSLAPLSRLSGSSGQTEPSPDVITASQTERGGGDRRKETWEAKRLATLKDLPISRGETREKHKRRERGRQEIESERRRAVN